MQFTIEEIFFKKFSYLFTTYCTIQYYAILHYTSFDPNIHTQPQRGFKIQFILIIKKKINQNRKLRLSIIM